MYSHPKEHYGVFGDAEMSETNTETKYIVHWNSMPPCRKEAEFPTLEVAEFWYNKKLDQDKDPDMYVKETTTSVTSTKLR